MDRQTNGWRICLHHVFSHDLGTFLINAETVRATLVEDDAVAWLIGVSDDPGRLRDPIVRDRLAALGLLRRDDGAADRRQSHETESVKTIALFVTQRCNLRCSYCYGDGGTYGDGGQMNQETAFRAIDWLIEQAVDRDKLSITFFGGEPFLNRSLIEEVVAYAKQRGREEGKTFSFGVTTNGTLLDDDIIEFMKENDFTPVISLDGPKDVNDRQRPTPDGRGSYDTIVPRVRKLLREMPDTPVRATLVGDTDPDVVIEGLKEVGFQRTNVVTASRSLFGNGQNSGESAMGSWLRKVEEEVEEFWSHVKDRNTEEIERLKIAGVGKPVYKMIEQFQHGTKRDFFCGAGRQYVGVSASGDVYPCHRLVGADGQRLGSVHDDDVDRDDFQPRTVTMHEHCDSCFARNLCAGGCHHSNLSATGSAFEPDREECPVIRRSVELAAMISARLSLEDEQFLIECGVITRMSCPLDMFP